MWSIRLRILLVQHWVSHSEKAQVGGKKRVRIKPLSLSVSILVCVSISDHAHNAGTSGKIYITQASGMSEEHGVSVGDTMVKCGDTRCQGFTKKDVAAIIRCDLTFNIEVDLTVIDPY